MMEEWWSITIKQGDRRSAISLVKWIDDGHIYWDGGPSYMTYHKKETEILKKYSVKDTISESDLWDRREYIHKRFHKDFPPKENFEVSGGWLSPLGEFYPCGHRAHLDTAHALAVVFFDEGRNGELRLEKEGWIKIYDFGMVVSPDASYFTDAQFVSLSILENMALESENEKYAKRIFSDLESMRWLIKHRG